MFNSVFQLDSRLQQTFSLSGGSTVKGSKTGSEIQRIDPANLEQIYISEPIVFNTVNIYTRGVLARMPYLASTEESDNEILREIESRWRLQTIVMPEIVKNMCIYGSSWNEIICGKDTGKILRLDTRDPKYMDISKSGFNSAPIPIVTDLGEPKYYVQYLTQYIKPKRPGSVIMQMSKSAIKYNTEDILRVTLYSLGDGLEGLGIVEPLYNASKNKADVEKATTQAILRLGNPIIYALVGDEKVYPTQQMIEAAGDAFRDINSRTGFAIPYYVKPEVLEPKRPEKLTHNLDYYNEQLITGGGVPKTLATGGGEGANKHTLSEQMAFLESTFDMMRSRISEAFKVQVLDRVEETERVKGIISLEWEEKAQRVIPDGAKEKEIGIKTDNAN